jgi:Ca2+-binding EF-hand superfamily protein
MSKNEMPLPQDFKEKSTMPVVKNEVTETAQVKIELATKINTEEDSKKSGEKEGLKTRVHSLLHHRQTEVSLLKLFDTLDVNDNGFLSTHEVLVGMHMLGLLVDPDEVMHSLKIIHKSEIGQMDPEQFLKFMQLITKTGDLSLLKKLMDALNSGMINSEKIQNVLKNSKSDLDERVKKHMTQLKEGGGHELSSKKQRVPLHGIGAMDDKAFEEEETIQEKAYNFFCLGSRYFITIITIWIFGATILYCLANGWSFGRAFYYSIQAGLSIGFGSLSEDKKSGTDMWSACATDVSELITAIYKQYPRNGTVGIASDGQICASYSETNPLADLSKFYTVLHLMAGASFISGILGIFASAAVESSDAWFEDLKDEIKAGKYDEDDAEAKPVSCGAKIAGFYDDRRTLCNSFFLLLTWLLIGVIYGVVKEEWTFITSLYYASAACSTGGLQGPTPDETGVWFTAFYSLIGVPIYGYTLGQGASLLTETFAKRQKVKTMTMAINQAEFDAASKLRNDSDSSGGIDLFDFTLMELYRLQRTSKAEVQEIWDNFHALDADKNGIFTRSEMQASLAFARFDKDGSYTLELGEMSHLVESLQEETSFEYPNLTMLPSQKTYSKHMLKIKMKEFDTPGGDDDGIVLNRSEFMTFWSSEFSESIANDDVGLDSGKMIELQHLMNILKEVKEK